MSPSEVSVPEQLPVLTRGKHRSPRKGACLMELVAYLAGERWSDSPACTHPLLATLARHVNDGTSDEARPRLAVLAPSLIGLTGDDLHIDVHVALRCATTALPVVAAEQQRAMAVAVLASERMLDALDGRPTGSLGEASRQALDQLPRVAAEAREFARGHRVSAVGFRRHAARGIVSSAVDGIAQARMTDLDQVLYGLLVDAISDYRAMMDGGEDAATAVDSGKWREVCRLTGSASAR
jgi:hypothetical protein